jgi:hypothetical protein
VKFLRIFACRLLLIPLLGLLGSYYGNAQPGLSTHQDCIVDIDPNSCTVKVSHCMVDANNDPLVKPKDTITWNPPKSFTIGFKPLGSTIAHTPVSAPTISSGKETVQTDFWCANDHYLCSYPYSLTRQGEAKACVDPGVRVVPPNPFAIYLWVGVVALTGFVAWKIILRNRGSSAR